ncbi:MAG: threonylcarbamoyl-AMP synthase [Gemmatimonadetes bacterium]|nr:threonylcarbamoyl-AMP synthase [Gemmatimonadota bacterium]
MSPLPDDAPASHVIAVDPQAPDATVIAEAAARLQRGELVAFPTETVYGLGANALDADAVARIYAAKGRPAWNPVIVHVPSIDAAVELAGSWPPAAARLAERCWPGPLTLVVPAGPRIPSIVTAGRPAVALRVPDHPVALALLRAAGVPVAAPSANRFTQVSPTTAAHVVQSLGARVPLVLDGGPCAVGIESTVVDCTGDTVRILRPGMLGRETLEAALSGLDVEVTHAVHRAIAHDATAVPEAPLAPGMADRHYAPQADVWLFEARQAGDIAQALAARPLDTHRTALVALLRTVTPEALGIDAACAVRMPTDAGSYARALYAALHHADRVGATLVCIEAPPPDEPAWEGVRDRLTRAAR